MALQDDQTYGENLLPFFILDVLRLDVESVETILQLLNESTGTVGWRDRWPHEFTHNEVVSQLIVMIHRNLVEVMHVERSEKQRTLTPVTLTRPDEIWTASSLAGNVEGALWFRPSEEGRRVWREWKQLTRSG